MTWSWRDTNLRQHAEVSYLLIETYSGGLMEGQNDNILKHRVWYVKKKILKLPSDNMDQTLGIIGNINLIIQT